MILHFLMKIDDRFEFVRSHILIIPKLPSVYQVYRILQQEETHKKICKGMVFEEPFAFSSSKRKFQEIPGSERHILKGSYYSKENLLL